MKKTLDLLDRALQIAPMPVWTEKFKLSRNAISTAKHSGHLTPVLAGNFAIELGEDPREWISRAVIEGEKDSPAKQVLQKRMQAMQTWSYTSLRDIGSALASLACNAYRLHAV